MANVGGQNLTHFEKASKLGHIKLIESDWVREILSDLSSDDLNDESLYDNSIWNEYKLGNKKPLEHIWVVDGSYVNVNENKKEVCFVKTALMTINEEKIAKIDKQYPHPMDLKEINTDSAMFHCTVFPLKNLRGKDGNLYDTVRHIIYDSMRHDYEGMYFETLKWLVYKKWDKSHNCNSPAFFCPHCNKEVEGGFPFDLDTWTCPHCHKELLLTDMLGFQQDMEDDFANLQVATSYMTIMEHLMLFTAIRIHWEDNQKSLVSDTLYIKDGPLLLGRQFAKLIPYIRDFLKFAVSQNRELHIIGCEKTGTFFDYLNLISKFVHVEKGILKYAVPSHGYIRKEIQRVADADNDYGVRTNWGEKVYVIIDSTMHLTLNVTPKEYKKGAEFPIVNDIVGLDRILETLPALISRQYEGALYPINLVNGIASLSNYPSANILGKFTKDTLSK